MRRLYLLFAIGVCACGKAGAPGGSDASPGRDAGGIDASPARDVGPAGDTGVSSDAAPHDGTPTGDASPAGDAAPSSDAAPHDGAPSGDASPIRDGAAGDGAPSSDAAPSGDAAPANDAAPTGDAAPANDAAPMSDAAPNADATPIDTGVAPDATPAGDGGTGITVTVAPRNVGLTLQQTRTFQANVQGTANTSVTWSVDQIPGGSATVGTISGTGVYVAPAAAGVHTIGATSIADPTQTGTGRAAVTDLPGIFTQRYQIGRTGQNTSELALDPAHVDQTQFGKLFSAPVDGYVYAEPLWAANVAIPNQGTHNVVYVATEHDSVYAFDADNPGPALWTVSFLVNGETTVPSADTQETADLVPEIGITGTPVIDPASQTLYVIAKTKLAPTTYFQRLHALDMATGQERSRSPVVITATIAGTAPDAVNGFIHFDPLIHMNRPGLLLANGIIYAAFGSHGDHNTYHGWVLGYDTNTLIQTVAYSPSPDSQASSIWQTGAGISADSTGNLYVETANGPFDVDVGGRDYGDSVIKLSALGTVLDYFTPAEQAQFNSADVDLGSGGTIILPDQPGAHPHIAIATGKPGHLYVLDRDAMGHFHAGADTQIIQTVDVNPNTTQVLGGIFATAAYWNGRVYIAGIGDNLKRFDFTNGTLGMLPASTSVTLFDYPGASPVVSASGTTNGITWLLEGNGYAPTGPATLHAYDALDLTRELYNSNQAPNMRDTAGNAVKFTVPTVANGKVYVPAQAELTVYGPLP